MGECPWQNSLLKLPRNSKNKKKNKRKDRVNHSPGIFSWRIRAGTNTGAACIRTAMKIPQECAKYSENNSSKTSRVRITGLENFSCVYWFCARGCMAGVGSDSNLSVLFSYAERRHKSARGNALCWEVVGATRQRGGEPHPPRYLESPKRERIQKGGKNPRKGTRFQSRARWCRCSGLLCPEKTQEFPSAWETSNKKEWTTLAKQRADKENKSQGGT